MEHLELVSGPTVTQTATLASSSAIVTGLTTSALRGALLVTGTGIPDATYVLSIDSATQVTLTQAANASGAHSLTFQIAPLTLAQAKLHCKVEVPDDDTLIALWIGAAMVRAQTLQRQTFLTTTYDWYQDQFPASANGYYNRLVRMIGPNPQWLPNGAAILTVPNPPLISVASVKYVDPSGVLQTVDPSTYVVSTGHGSRIQPVIGNVWPVVRPQIDAVVVRFTAGLGATADAVPDNVKAAMLLLIGHWYINREAVADVMLLPVPETVDALLSATDPGIYS